MFPQTIFFSENHIRRTLNQHLTGQEMQTICISLMSEKWVWGRVALVLQTDSTIVQETCLS